MSIAVVQKMIEKALKTLRVITWTPSRYAKWKECPRKVLLEDLMHMCPMCYEGTISGGFNGEPVVCSHCKSDQPERSALERGNRLDDALTVSVAVRREKATPQDAHAVLGSLRDTHKEDVKEATQHPAVAKLVRQFKKTRGVLVQESIVLARGWKRVNQFTKGAWGRLKLDVLIPGPKAQIFDWKSGNIDKSKGVIREKAEYQDSMRAYQVAVLSVTPEAKSASATMVFLDAPPDKIKDPTKSLPVLKRSELQWHQQAIEEKLEPMFADTRFSPRPGYYCSWCPFSKKMGGPCPHG